MNWGGGRTLYHHIELEYVELVGQCIHKGDHSLAAYPEVVAGIKDYTFKPFQEQEGVLTMAQAKAISPIEFTYVEELTYQGMNRAFIERESEGSDHSYQMQHAIHSLRRLGYKVYPGGVGIPGIPEMADFLAIDGNSVLLGEALTTSSIKKHNAHLKKLRLIESGVPIFFIGELPAEFIDTMPSSAFSIFDPRSAFTSGLEVTRFYWSNPDTPPVFTIKKIKTGRKKSIYEIDVTGIKIPEDASDFWISALQTAYKAGVKKGEKNLMKPIFRRNSPHISPGYAPCAWNREKYTKFKFEGLEKFKGSSVTLGLGRYPLVAELEGESALEALHESLSLLKTPSRSF